MTKRKGITIFFGIITILLGISLVLINLLNSRNTVVLVDSKPIEATATIIDGNMYVPTEPLFESLGWKVVWDPQKNILKCSSDDIIYQFKGNSNQFIKNDDSKIMNHPLYVLGGVSFISRDFIAKELGTTIKWNGKDNIIISGKDKKNNFSIFGESNIVIAGDGVIVNIFQPCSDKTINDLLVHTEKLLNINPEEAIKKYKDILTSFMPDEMPKVYAQIMNNIGNGYSMKAEYSDTRQNIENAVMFYTESLDYFTKAKDEAMYYSIITNLANAKRILSGISNHPELIQEALEYYSEAANYYNKEKSPLDYGLIQYNIGTLYKDLGKKESKKYLENAKGVYKVLLDKNFIDKSSFNYEQIKYNLYRTEFLLSDFSIDSKTLEDTFSSLLDILKTWTLESFPLQYAKVCNLMGNIYHRLYEKENNSRYFDKSLICYEDALNIFTYEKHPASYARINKDIGDLYSCYSNKKYINKSLEYYNNSLKVYDTLNYPKIYALIYNKIKNIDPDMSVKDLEPGRYKELLFMFNDQSNENKNNPCLIDNILMIPAKDILELYGFEASDNKDEVKFIKGENVLYINTKNSKIKYNNHNIIPDKNPLIIDNCLYISKDVFSEVLKIEYKILHNSNMVVSDGIIPDITGSNNILVLGSNNIANISTKYDKSKIGTEIKNADLLLNSKNFVQAIKSYEKILKSISSKDNLDEYIHVILNLGNSYLELSLLANKEENCLRALSMFEEVIQKSSKTKHDKSIGLAYKGLGNTYGILGRIRTSAEYSTKALDALSEALNYIKKDTMPLEYAQINDCISDVYKLLWSVSNPLQNALKAFESNQEAISAIDPLNYPNDYYILKAREGILLTVLYSSTGDMEYFTKSCNSYEQALKYFKFYRDPDIYAYINFHYGALYEYVGIITSQKEHLNKGIDKLNKCLKVSTIDKRPFFYASAQNHKAILYLMLLIKSGGSDYGDKALLSFNEAQKVLTIENFPIEYAILETDLGVLYGKLGKIKKSEEHFKKALKCFDNSLKILTIDNYPDSNARTMAEKAIVLTNYFDLTNHINYLQEAIKCFNVALKKYNLEDSPVEYAQTQKNLGETHVKMSSFNEYKMSSLINAIEAYKNALKVFETLNYPDNASMLKSNLGDCYSSLSSLENKDLNTKLALNFYKEALEYFTIDKFKDKHNSIMEKIKKLI